MTDIAPVIVYVDDEQRILDTFETLLPRNIHLVTFNDPNECLKKISNHPSFTTTIEKAITDSNSSTIYPWIIISDQKMPQMEGLDFLQKARQILNDTYLIMLTGYSNEDLTIKCINDKHHIDYFLKKPITKENLTPLLTKFIHEYQKKVFFHSSSDTTYKAWEAKW
ncbi:MAG: response regulator [Oligoflexia bacterium]|nr:response regulator [Oligoflexia bacterium]